MPFRCCISAVVASGPMCRRRSVSRYPVSVLCAIACSRWTFSGVSPGNSRMSMSWAGVWQGGQLPSGQLEHPPVCLGESSSHLGHLLGRTAGADHRPDRRLIGGVEQRRQEPRSNLLQGGDHRIAATDVHESGCVVIERQKPGDLVANRWQLAGVGAVYDAVHTGPVLTKLDSDLGVVAVEGKRHPRDPVKAVRGAAAEPELR